MKICFVQKQSFPYFGIMALSEVLKQKGHATDVLISTNEDDLISKIKTIGPDIIGMSVH
jgi:chemotaxis response regulator CheB